jgi:hypothetical protein
MRAANAPVPDSVREGYPRSIVSMQATLFRFIVNTNSYHGKKQ